MLTNGKKMVEDVTWRLNKTRFSTIESCSRAPGLRQ